MPLQGGRGLRGETCQLINTLRGLLETPGKQQGGGDQPHPLRRAEHQLVTVLLMQAQQQHGVLLTEQVFETEVLQQADRRFVLLGQQRLLERRLPILGRAEPLAGAPVPGAPGRPGFVAQQLGQRREDLQPVRRVFPGLDKRPQGLKFAQVVGTIAKAKQVFA